MVEDLEADPALRGRYQFWTFRYASGDSIPYSAHLLRQSLRRARRVFDPDGTDAAFDRMVVVGHSLGGILAKMMVQSSGSRLWQNDLRTAHRPGRPVRPKTAGSCGRRSVYDPVPEVRRVVFIATPHRGSPLATRPAPGAGYTALLPDKPLQPGPRGAAGEQRSQPVRSRIPERTPDERRRAHPRAPAPLEPSATWGSIRRSAPIRSSRTFVTRPGPDGTDGIVPYSSSHLEGVASERLVHGLHICLNDPAVIREVRRILREHAGIDPTSRTDHGGLAQRGLESRSRKMTRGRDEVSPNLSHILLLDTS